MQKRILIVDDEPAIRDMVAFALRKGEYDPVHAGDAREAQAAIAERVPDLILLDWMLPGTSGLELARRWRRDALTREIPIIMLTARGEENDRVGGLEAGVDDYVVKPFSARELLARIRAVLRRSREDDEDGSVQVGGLRIDGASHRVYAGDAREAQAAIAERVPDLILLDWMLPGTSGLELARRWRRDALTRDIPIIMLTARGEENDRVGGLEAGVDDYVVKPFSARELLARIRAVMRRSRDDDEDGSVAVGSLRIDGAAHRVFAGDTPVPIGPTEYRLLHFFMTHPERVYSRTQLLDHVWGGSVYVEERTVDVHIRRLRKTLEPHGLENMVQTVRGSGYRFSASM